jgi:uncharacterized phiE125 gp8 family phage protein
VISTRVTTAPSGPPITLAAARQYARVGADEEMPELAALLRGATALVERETEMALVTRECEARLDAFWGDLALVLAWPPLQSVEAINYTDADGNEQTVDPDVYVVDTHSRPGRVYLAPNQSWPTDVQLAPHAVRVQYTCGFGDDADELEDVVECQGHLDALRLLLSERDEFRNALISGTIIAEVPFALRNVLRAEQIPDASETRVECLAA